MKVQTPFRYPGAKNKLLPVLMEHLSPMLASGEGFLDMFVGGGSVLLAVAAAFPEMPLFANDKDPWVSSFWKTVACSSDEEFSRLLALLETKPTVKLFDELRAAPAIDQVGEAYRALFFNRTSFSGILSSGCIGGKEQKSKWTVDCRYNAGKLIEKTVACRKLLLGRTEVSRGDFAEVPSIARDGLVWYVDPPYWKQGDALYPEKMNEADHARLAALLIPRKKWVLSYDNASEIREFYRNCDIRSLAARYSINGKKDTWASKDELVILPT